MLGTKGLCQAMHAFKRRNTGGSQIAFIYDYLYTCHARPRKPIGGALTAKTGNQQGCIPLLYSDKGMVLGRDHRAEYNRSSDSTNQCAPLMPQRIAISPQLYSPSALSGPVAPMTGMAANFAPQHCLSPAANGLNHRGLTFYWPITGGTTCALDPTSAPIVMRRNLLYFIPAVTYRWLPLLQHRLHIYV